MSDMHCRALWNAVIVMAVKDMFSGRGVEALQAQTFLMSETKWYHQVCDMAGIDGKWLRRKIDEISQHPTKKEHLKYLTNKLYPAV